MSTDIDYSVENAILNFLNNLGIDISNYKFTNGNLMISCPFAPISGHKRGVDKKPSFGIKFTGAGFYTNCFTCGRKSRSLLEFYNSLIVEGVVDKDNKTDIYEMQNALKFIYPAYDEIIYKSIRKTKKVKYKEWLDDHPKLWAYNIKRGLNKEVIIKCKLKFNEKHSSYIFPVYDFNNLFVGYVEHNFKSNFAKYINSKFDKSEYLYLEWLIKPNTKIIVVEGIYDTLLVYKHLYVLNLLDEYSVVGLFGSKISLKQVKKLAGYAKAVLVMSDNDIAGIEMNKNIYEMMHKRFPLLFKINYNRKDPGEIKSDSEFYNYLNSTHIFPLNFVYAY